MMANHTEDVMIETPYTMILKRARLKAKGVLARFVGYSPLGSAMLTADTAKAATAIVDNLKVLILPNSDPFVGTVTVTLRATATGCTIRYTTNGSTPTAASTLYSTPFTVTNVASANIQAIAIQPDGKISKVAKRILYHKIAADPTFSPDGGEFSTSVDITLASATASIRYTDDGSTPSAGVGTVYSGPITITATKTIKAIAYYPAVGGTSSAVVSKTFTAV